VKHNRIFFNFAGNRVSSWSSKQIL